MKAFDYTTISEDIKLNIKNEVKAYDLNSEIILISRISDNPKDNYLYAVMAKGGFREGYNVWLYNSSLGGLYEGHYDMNFVEAMQYFSNKRISTMKE